LLETHFPYFGVLFSRRSLSRRKNAKCKISAKLTGSLVCHLTAGACTTCGYFASVVSSVDEACRIAVALVKLAKQKPAIFAQSVG
jgi:hypothetical protein